MILFLLQSAALLVTFNAELARADVQEWRGWFFQQVRQESAWNTHARNRFSGAEGLTQFMPATWEDEAHRVDPPCDDKPRTDGECSIRVGISYMKRIFGWVGPAATEADRIALALSAFNGGIGNQRKEKRACRQESRCSTSSWWGNVAEHCLRSAANCRENRDYPDIILGRAGLI